MTMRALTKGRTSRTCEQVSSENLHTAASPGNQIMVSTQIPLAESGISAFATWFMQTHAVVARHAVVSTVGIKPTIAARGGENRPFDD
jgi:hypothetical protein